MAGYYLHVGKNADEPRKTPKTRTEIQFIIFAWFVVKSGGGFWPPCASTNVFKLFTTLTTRLYFPHEKARQ